MYKIDLILENLNMVSRTNIIEESSNETVQKEYEMVQLFISEATDMLNNGLIDNTQNLFLENMNLIFESYGQHEYNDAPDDHSGLGIAAGLASLGAIGYAGARNYLPAKQFINRKVDEFKNSETNASFKEIGKDLGQAKEAVVKKYNQFQASPTRERMGEFGQNVVNNTVNNARAFNQYVRNKAKSIF